MSYKFLHCPAKKNGTGTGGDKRYVTVLAPTLYKS